MKKYVIVYLAMIVIMIVLDFMWLSIFARPLYQHGIGHLMAEQPNLVFAVLFYAVYVSGLIVYALKPHASICNVGKTVWSAAMYGFFIYASYELTNLALLKNWPISLALIDFAWGVLISCFTALIGKVLLNKIIFK